MRENIEKIIKEEINPKLKEHLGKAEMTGYEDKVVYIKLKGACASCPLLETTMEEIVKKTLMEKDDSIKDVVLDKSVNEDLLDMARKILSKK